MTEKALTALTACLLFEGCDTDLLLSALEADGCEEKQFSSGETITEHENQHRIGLLLSGSAAVHPADGEKNVLLRTLNAGDVFGVANLFDSEARFVSRITAKKSCRVLFVSDCAVKYLLENDKAFMYRYISFLSGRIQFLNRKIMYYTSGSAERRLALYLISFGCDTITPDLPMNALADLLDIGRASLYRAIDSLTDEGHLRRDGNGLVIVDRDKLIESYNLE